MTAYIWFDKDYIYGRDEDGKEYKQSLLWYPKLRAASDMEREHYTYGYDGIHWRGLDEDISFESFTYEDAEPSPMQHFFLTHKEINVAEFARSLGMNATLLRNYINGFKKPSAERENAILDHIHKCNLEDAAIIDIKTIMERRTVNEVKQWKTEHLKTNPMSKRRNLLVA